MKRWEASEDETVVHDTLKGVAWGGSIRAGQLFSRRYHTVEIEYHCIAWNEL